MQSCPSPFPTKSIYLTRCNSILENPDHAQLFSQGPLSTNLSSLSVSITLFFHPGTASSKSDLFPFRLIKCNSIPHAFFTENTHPTFLKSFFFPILSYFSC